jgi:hypothetical protein
LPHAVTEMARARPAPTARVRRSVEWVMFLLVNGAPHTGSS